jgi:cell division protein FtsI/penicillin-binding protein 2
MSKGFASSYRIVLLGVTLFACFGALGVRLVWLHVIEREVLLRTIARVRPMLIAETARRGDILDARGARLATSRSEIILGVDPHALRPKDAKKWSELAALLELPEAELRQKFTPRYNATVSPAPVVALVPVVETAASDAGTSMHFNVTPQPTVSGPDMVVSANELSVAEEGQGPRPITWVILKDPVSETLYERINKLNVHGVYGLREYRRAYPSNQLASHIVGYVNREQQAAAGIEAYADFYLRGQQGWRVSERDGSRRELPQFGTRDVPRVDGYNVMLSLDSTVQDIVEQELAYLGKKFEPLKASIIVSDLDGFILAMANYPTFNLNEYNQVPKSEEVRMKNVAVADIYDPGSVFKIVPAAAALEERLVTPLSVIDCTLEKVAHKGRMLPLPGEDHQMGRLSVSEVISHSSNRGAAQLGVMLGEERLYRYARMFGFGAKLGFPVGGEVSGILHPYQKWYPIDLTRIPMGHSVSATVLQMHQAMAVIASGGVLLRPQIIRQISDASNEIVYRYGRVELGRAVSPDTAAKLAVMLTGVTKKGGTAVEAAIEGFDVAGKTGTSQKFINGEWSKKHHIASFVGFFPATRPKVVISVMVDDADHKATGGVAYGRTVAAPSFKRIGERLIPLPTLDIKSDAGPARPGLMARHEGVFR